MKTNKRLWLLVLIPFLVINMRAYDAAEIDGIYYIFYYGNEAQVTSKSYSGNVVIPSSVSYNGKSYSVTSIGDNAFSKCTGLTSVSIPNSVTYIGEWAFYGCTGLTSFTIPNSVRSIRRSAFAECTSLTSITISEGVKDIGYYVFANCTGLTSITIPNSVTYIGEWAFNGCYFSERNFINKSSLTSSNTWGATLCDDETIDGLLIKDNCVIKCRKWATSVTIPNTVTSIGHSAFSSYSGLTSVTIPNSVTSIENNAFKNCTGLTSITIPNSVKSIGEHAFEFCTGLTSINIPSSVTSIGYRAFGECYKLATIIIPESVTNIGMGAFSCCGCYSGRLTYVKVNNIIRPFYDAYSVFSNTENAVLCVPVGCKASYASTAYQKSFRKIIEFHDGDVNADEKTNVLDVVDIARFVVRTPSESFVEIIADINRDGSVNLSDAVVLVNEIAGDQNFARAMFVPENEIINDALLLKGVNGNYSLSMTNEQQYTAFQFDLYVPEDIEFLNVMLNDQRKQGHQLLYNKVENGHYCVAALSLSNSGFNGVNGELVNIAVNGVAGNEVSICNIHFFDVYGNDYQFDDINGSTTTDMNSLFHAFSKGGKAIYDLQGRKREKLQRGVNIVNGKKILF